MINSIDFNRFASIQRRLTRRLRPSHLAHELADAAALRHEVHALRARVAQVEDRGAVWRQPAQTATSKPS